MKQPINSILFSPAGDINIASTRIRIYSILPILTSLNIRSSDKPSFKNLVKADIFFVQKKVNKETLTFARVAKALNIPIIYDIDDLGEALRSWVKPDLYKKMICLADKITVGSDSQKQILQTIHPDKLIAVIPPVVDYFPSQPMKQIDQVGGKLRIIWFGNSMNVYLFEKYIDVIAKINNVQIIVVADKKSIDQLSQKYPFIQYEMWSLDTFTDILRSCQLSVLMHDGSIEDQAKTNNKMITSIIWGVPAIVSNTAEYEITAKQAGIENAIFSDPNELFEGIERLRTHSAREIYLDRAQPIIWKNHSPETITHRFLNVVIDTKKGNIIKRMKQIICSYN